MSVPFATCEDSPGSSLASLAWETSRRELSPSAEELGRERGRQPRTTLLACPPPGLRPQASVETRGALGPRHVFVLLLTSHQGRRSNSLRRRHRSLLVKLL